MDLRIALKIKTGLPKKNKKQKKTKYEPTAGRNYKSALQEGNNLQRIIMPKIKCRTV